MSSSFACLQMDLQRIFLSTLMVLVFITVGRDFRDYLNGELERQGWAKHFIIANTSRTAEKIENIFIAAFTPQTEKSQFASAGQHTQATNKGLAQNNRQRPGLCLGWRGETLPCCGTKLNFPRISNFLNQCECCVHFSPHTPTCFQRLNINSFLMWGFHL